MAGIAQKILEHSASLPEGAVLSAKTLLHLGSRAGVDQALSRLARSGHLLRVGRGLYAPPVHSRFGTRAPQPASVVEGIAALKDELQPELMRVVFKDAGFKDEVVKTNAVQRRRQAGLQPASLPGFLRR